METHRFRALRTESWTTSKLYRWNSMHFQTLTLHTLSSLAQDKTWISPWEGRRGIRMISLSFGNPGLFKILYFNFLFLFPGVMWRVTPARRIEKSEVVRKGRNVVGTMSRASLKLRACVHWSIPWPVPSVSRTYPWHVPDNAAWSISQPGRIHRCAHVEQCTTLANTTQQMYVRNVHVCSTQ